jgi:hypothetical protein
MMSMRKSNILRYLGIFLRHSGLEFRRELTLDQDRLFNTCSKNVLQIWANPLLLSMHFGSSQETMTTTDDNAKIKMNV